MCRPSCEHDMHDGYDHRKQAVKMADVYGVEKVWAAIYEGNRQHGDFSSKERKPNQRFNRIFCALRDEEVCSTLVGRA